jgi:hypothetical protein
MSDPARVEGPEAERRSAFGETYELLDRLTDRFIAETVVLSPPPAAAGR